MARGQQRMFAGTAADIQNTARQAASLGETG
jgi:hypothetical protein